jgi:hypothetical protein
MLFDWFIELYSHFPVFDRALFDFGIIPVARKIPLPSLALFNAFGSLGFAAAGVWAIDRLMSLPSRETKLLPDRSGVVHRHINSEHAAALSLGGAKAELETPLPDFQKRPDVPAAASGQIDVAAFAPPAVAPGDDFYIQVVLLSPEQLADAKVLAEGLEPGSELLRSVSLKVPLNRGDQVRITLEGRGAEIQEAQQTFTWQGYVAHIAFATRLPARFGQREYKPLIRVFLNGAPVGIIELKIKAILSGLATDVAPVTERAWRFDNVFLSYASDDRVSVLEMAKVLKALKINFFQDTLSLEPGQRWEKEIYKQIAVCDAFFLFWSSHAKKSEWVMREALLALQYQKESREGLPHFMPIIVEGPPIAAPPRELADIHFSDPIQHIIFAEKLARAKQQPDGNGSSRFND